MHYKITIFGACTPFLRLIYIKLHRLSRKERSWHVIKIRALMVINAEIVSALSIHLTLLKTWNRVYKCWVRPELQHDLFRSTDYCNCMTWYQVISTWLVKKAVENWTPQCLPCMCWRKYGVRSSIWFVKWMLSASLAWSSGYSTFY